MTTGTTHATLPQSETVGDAFMPSVTIDGATWTLADQARVCAEKLRSYGYAGDADLLISMVTQLHR